jgi:hypothetical protein
MSNEFTDGCPTCNLEKRFQLLFHLVLFMKADNLIKELEDFAKRGLTEEELSNYEEQTLAILNDPEKHGAVPIIDM